MDNLNIFLSGFLFFLAALTIFLAAYSLAYHKAAIAKAFSFFCICISFYSFGYAMELISSNLNQMLTWNAVKYIGLPFIPAFWVVLALLYTDRERFLRPIIWLSIFAIPLFTILARYTNDWHHLFYTSVRVDTGMLFPVLFVEKGPLYLIQGFFMAFCVVFSCYLYLLQYKRSSGIIRTQCVIMIAASALPWLTFIPNVLNISPYAIDFGPFVGSISCVLFLIALFRFEFLNLKPLARDKVFQCTKDGIIVLDANYCIIDYNAAAANIIPALNDQSIKENIQSVLHKRDLIDSILAGREFSYKTGRKDEIHHYTVRTSEILEKKGQTAGYLITITDITGYISSMKKLQELASIDGLTGIFNRRHFFEQSSRELEKARRQNYGLSVIILDIDFFKEVNDNYGHQAGDSVLQYISRICQQSIRTVDILGRYGGEEFIIFLPNTTVKDSVVVANRVKKKIEAAEIPYQDELIKVTASFGVTGIDMVKNETLSYFLKHADDALYRAKSGGRNRVQVIPLPLSEAGG